MATSSAMNTSNQYIKYTISVTQNSQSVTDNTSNVTVSVRFYRTNTGYTTYGSGTVYCKINGTTYNASVTSSHKITNSGIVLFTKTLNIPHNADGAKTLTCSAWISHSQFTASEQSYTQTLTAIPRKSVPSLSASSVQFGNSITINTNRKSSSFTHHLYYSINGGSDVAIATNVGASYAWTVPASLMNSIPNATSAKITFKLFTFSGSTNIGYNTISFTATVPSNVIPSCTLTVTDATGYSDKYGGYIKGLSKLNVLITPTTAYGSAIASYSTTANGSTYTQKSFTTGVLKSSGSLTINTTVKDGRGRSGSATKTVSVVDYAPPTISNLKVRRCNIDGVENDQGNYVQIFFDAEVTTLSNKNSALYVLEFKASNESTYRTIDVSNLNGRYSITNFETIFEADTGSSYDIRLTVSDDFNTTSSSTVASTAFSLMHFNADGTGIGFGKISELSNTADFGLDARFNKPVYGNVMGLNRLPRIPAGSDLNNYMDTGSYAVYGNADAETIANMPIPKAGRLEISAATGEGIRSEEWSYLRQKFMPYSLNYPVYERDVSRSDDNVWTYGPWYATSIRGQKILWSGAWPMNANQSFTLSERVSEQPNGIVLIFSRYANGAVEDNNLNSFFVPKKLVELMPGVGSAFNMTAVNFSYICAKYLYISDDRITGNAINEQTGTNNGVTYANNAYVLRYIIGV